jgi:hypothetical protein
VSLDAVAALQSHARGVDPDDAMLNRLMRLRLAREVMSLS